MASSAFSEAYRDHPQYLHHIIPTDFSSLRSLPESYAWPQTGANDDDAGGGSGSSIPVIDMMDPKAEEKIGFACEEWGVFQVKNHGVALSLIEEVEAEAKRLFALPVKQKMKALRDPNGATGYGRARISPFFAKYMWHEGFTIMGSPSQHAKQIWPHDYAPFCELMENYQKQMRLLAEKLTSIILTLLGISEEESKWVGSSGSNEAVQLNHYPQCPEPNRAMGLAPHTDTSLFTILHQSQIQGLQIFKDQLGWVPVRPDPHALVVNAGDLLHIISNARFPCVLHKVIVNRLQHRYSVAYFYSPPLDYVLSSSLPLGDEQARFRGITVKEYIGIKAKNLGKALSLISAN